ncbi:MAG: hypothetical protein ACOX3G_06240 [Armatimonadota bacterium]|jgi:hypothetical protein
MKKTIVVILIALFAISVPTWAAKVLVVPYDHCDEPFVVYQAYCGATCPEAGNQVFQGLNGFGDDVITAVPGVLAIDPGGTCPENGWPNFVTASTVPNGLSWQITNIALKKEAPAYFCSIPAFNQECYTVQGSNNVRLWWPLMYELPGTCWKLTVSYKTDQLWADPANPNHPSTAHQEVWCWYVDADLEHLDLLVDLFHELPVGSLQVPIICSEALYDTIKCKIDALICADPADPQTTAKFWDLRMFIENNCDTALCGEPFVECGIRNTLENPACCKLQADVEYIGNKLGVFFPAK